MRLRIGISLLLVILLIVSASVITGAAPFTKFTKVQLGTKACGAETLLLGAGAKSGGEYAWSTANRNAVDFRCASTATSGWAHAGAFYLKQQGVGGSASALRGYAYADDDNAANTGEISGVYGIGELHGGTSGGLSAIGKLMGLRGRVAIPTGLTITTGNYYGLLIETDIQSSLASATDSAYIKIADLRSGTGLGLHSILTVTGVNSGTANTNTYKTNAPSTATITGALKVYINGTEQWIALIAKGS